MLVGSTLRAEGIALSHNGLTWLTGAGEYGGGWGAVGKGISVSQGGSFYVKIYSQSRNNLALYYAPHGAEWGSWSSTGPVLAGAVGDSSTNAVILKFSNVGTPRSTVAWINGSGGLWAGLGAVGAYDLALHDRALWTLPPINIIAAPPAGFWAGVVRFFKSDEAVIPGPADTTTRSFELSVPDGGGTAALLGVGLISVALVWRVVHARRLRERKFGQRSLE